MSPEDDAVSAMAQDPLLEAELTALEAEIGLAKTAVRTSVANALATDRALSVKSARRAVAELTELVERLHDDDPHAAHAVAWHVSMLTASQFLEHGGGRVVAIGGGMSDN